jgi:hypothetical protein
MRERKSYVLDVKRLQRTMQGLGCFNALNLVAGNDTGDVLSDTVW